MSTLSSKRTLRSLPLWLSLFTYIIILTSKADAALNCFDCHGSPPPATVDFRPLDATVREPATGGFQGNHRNHMAQTTNAAACAVCHPDSSDYSSSHRDGDIKVSSRINNSPDTTYYPSYKNNTSSWHQTTAPDLGKCASVNCHFEKETPTWGSATFTSPANCDKCHGAAPTDGTHPKHAAYYGIPAATNSCLRCHPDHTGDPGPFTHATSAGNRGLAITFAESPNNGSGSYSGNTNYPNYLPSSTPARNGSCTATYCHSKGTKATAPFTSNQTATWGGTLGCAGCHLATPDTGSHIVHVDTTYAVPAPCYKCHTATVSAGMTISSPANHVNKKVDVAFSSTTTAVLGKYSGLFSPMQKNPGSGKAKCENIYCHSSGQGANGSWPPTYTSPKWGQPIPGTCAVACHNNGLHGGANITSGSHDKHIRYGFATDGFFVGCTICHYGAGYAEPACTQCHFDAPSLTSLHVNHKIEVSFVTMYGGAYNGTPEPGDGYGTCSNIYCHSNGASLSTGIVPANTSPAWGSEALACNGCHGNPPSYSTGNPKKNSHASHAAYGCSKCHYRTTTNGTSITNTANHVNKAYDVYSGAGDRFTYSFNAGGGTCNSISCHGTSNAKWGSTACLDCHSVAQGNRVAVASQFNGSNSHHIQGAVTDAQCYQCHWEANSDGTINSNYHNATISGAAVRLVVYSTLQRPTNAAKYFIAYTANGKRSQIQKINNHCLGCHSTANDTATPFGDGKTPKQYAWDGTSVAARYSQTGTTSWGKYTSANTAKKKISKAFSAHGNVSPNQRGWNKTNGVDGDITDTGGTSNVQCYDCHNSHGSTVAGITSRYSSATGRQRGGILKDTVAGKGGYAIAYKPYTGGSIANKNRRNPGANICLDCHMSSTAGTTPWGYTSTYGVSQSILGYNDSPFMGYTTAGSEQRYPFKKAFPFKGGHFGSSSPLTVQPSAANQINGLCTPCHDPHGVSPTLAGNQKYGVPLLKGTWLTSPYKEDTAPANNVLFTARTEGVPYYIDQNTFGSGLITAVTGITETTGDTPQDSQSAGLCLGCHTKTSLTDGVTHDWKNKNRIHESVKGWKSANATVKHNYSCSKCHGAHSSSVLPRLMVTNCLDSQHKGRSSWTSPAVRASGEGGYTWCDAPATGLCWSYLGLLRYNGSGAGRIPGSWRGDKQGFGNNSVACHEGKTGSAIDQRWNSVTPWGIYPPITIASGPSAALSGLQAAVTWSTNIPSGSSVSYGTTNAYGSTATVAPTVMNHSVTLPGLTNHATYHYQATSLASDGQQIASPDSTFYLSVPPSVPTLIAQPSSAACSDTCAQTLQWNAATDPDAGPIQYQVQVSSNSDFSATVYDSGWISGTSATTGSLATNTNYWWRVQTRDGDHTTAQDPTSGWSATGSYSLSSILTAVPAIGVPSNIATTTIRWNFTDNADNEDGFKVHDTSNNIKASLASPNLAYLDESGLIANTQYTRHIHAYNAAGGDSGPSANASIYTLPTPPNVTANRTASIWYTTAGTTFSFGNAAGFGSGGVQYYRYVWDQNPTYSFNDTETQWSSGTLTLTPASEGVWYLHVKSYNGNDVANGANDYGPFQYDATAPAGLADNRTPANMAMNQPIDTTLNALAADSGSSPVEYWFQMATDIGFSYNVQNSGWQASASFAPTLSLGPTYYWRVKARDGAYNETAYTAASKFTTAPYSMDWTTMGDLENNASTSGSATIRNNAKVAGGSNTADNGAVISTFKYITSGSGNSLAVRPDGSVWTWGMYNSASQVSGLGPNSGVIAVAAGYSHFLVLKSDGSVWAWGSNNNSQIGNGTTGGTVVNPVQVSGLGANSGVVAVAAGQFHSLALKSDGSVWAWGANSYGSLGNGSTSGPSINTPAQVSGLGPNSGVTAISAGIFHTLAVKSDGTIWAWGANGDGRLGDGSTIDRGIPVQVSQASGLVSNPGGIAVATGSYHSLAITSDGSIWAWGSNNYGQLGISNNNNSLTPSHVTQTVNDLTTAIAVSGGNYHSMAIKSDGSVWTWGRNGLSQLGDGTSTNRNAPVRVSGANLSSGAVAVAGGENYSLAVKSDGSVWAWGNYTASPTLFPSTTVHAIDNGTISNLTLDAGSNVSWNNVFWNARTPSNTTIKFRTRGANTPEALAGLDPDTGWTDYYTISGSPIFTPNSRLLEVQLILQASASFTPTLDDFSITYDNEQVDNADPQSTVATPAAGVITSAADPYDISGAATDDAAILGIEVSTNGGAIWQPASCSGCPGPNVTWTYAWTLPADGSYTVRSRATDKSGKIETPAAGNAITLDRYAPMGLGNSFPANSATGLSTSTSVTAVAATDSGSGPVQYWFQVATNSGFSTGLQESSAWQTGTSFAPTLASNITYYWRVKARDASGNETGYTPAWSFTTMLPAVVWTTKGDLENNASTSGTATTRNLVQASGTDPADDAAASLKLMNFATISNGQFHTLAIKSDGSVWSWGWNDNGQLGNGTSCYTCVNSTPVQVSGFGPGSGVISVAGGGSHSLAVKSDGSVWAWGANDKGQLGDGTTTPQYSPIQVSGFGPGSGVIAVAAGSSFSLALKADGTVWGWGKNDFDQLGFDHYYNGTILTPRQVPDLSGVTAVAAGQSHTMALKSDGTVWALGSNYNGQLGNVSIVYDTITPVQVSGLSDILSVAAGGIHSLAVKSDGSVWAWGSNAYGQIGDGSTTQRATPFDVFGSGSDFISVTGGYDYSLAVKSDGSVFAWGNNIKGQLGDNSTTQRNTPVQVSGLITGSEIKAATAGFYHSTALKTDGSVLAWGDNAYGKLNNGTSPTNSVIPIMVADFPAISESAGPSHSLAVRADGTVWAWGRNNNGQLGNNSTTDSKIPVQVSGFDPGSGVIAVAAGSATAGGSFSLALKSDGTVWGWGSNSSGQLGIGVTGGTHYIPEQVKASAGIPLTGITSIAAGSSFAMALNNFGNVMTWGSNTNGQLGNGTTTASYYPVQVVMPDNITPLSGIKAIAGGSNFALAATDGGPVWSWGNNNSGQLGDGTTDLKLNPVPVSGLADVSMLAAAGTTGGSAFGFSLAVKTDNTVWSWGANGTGQLGNGNTTGSTIPVQVVLADNITPLSGITKIAAGAGTYTIPPSPTIHYYGFSLARKEDGTVWSWGSNYYGQLGDGTTTDRSNPVQILNISGVDNVAAGAAHAVTHNTTGNTIWSWGNSNFGQLGKDTSIGIVPAQCLISGVKQQSSYPSSGSITNLRNNLCQRPNWGMITWQGTTPANTAIQFRTREADTEAGLVSATWSAPYSTSGATVTSSSSPWAEIGLSLLSSDGIFTPTLDDFTITCVP